MDRKNLDGPSENSLAKALADRLHRYFPAGMSEAKICEELGISNRTVGGWRKGSSPSIDTVAIIAKRLNVSPAELAGFVSPDDSLIRQASDELSAVLDRLGGMHRRMTSDPSRTARLVHVLQSISEILASETQDMIGQPNRSSGIHKQQE